MSENLEEQLAELSREAGQLEDATARELIQKVLGIVSDISRKPREPLVFRNEEEVLDNYEKAGKYELRASIECVNINISLTYNSDEVSKLNENSILLTQSNEIHNKPFYYDDFQEKHFIDLEEEVYRVARDEARNRGHDAVFYNETEIFSNTRISISDFSRGTLDLGHPRGTLKYSCKIPIYFYDQVGSEDG
ncbi:MAG: hypothetical protein ABIH72_02610 [archaeon]